MRVWRVAWHSIEDPTRHLAWFATKVEAEREVRSRKKALPRRSYVDCTAVTVPVTKDGIVLWLNRNLMVEIPIGERGSPIVGVASHRRPFHR